MSNRELSKRSCLSIPHREGKLPGNSVPYCKRLIFSALFVCGFWSWEKEAEPLKMRTKPGAAKASFRISFPLHVFHVACCPARATAGFWGVKEFCLLDAAFVKSLLGKQCSCAVYGKCQAVGQKSSFWFNPRPRCAPGRNTAYTIMFLLFSLFPFPLLALLHKCLFV